MTRLVVDTGPLVAWLNARERHHAWIRELLAEVDPPLLTCEAVVSEACFLLRGQQDGPAAVIALVERGVLDPIFRLAGEEDAIGNLMRKYAAVPMSFADACLVRMTELDPKATIVTLDADFAIYRRHGRQVVPTIMPRRG
ncbi:MAG: PIN domain-containing protein [Phycisphaerales bacterium]